MAIYIVNFFDRSILFTLITENHVMVNDGIIYRIMLNY